MTSTSENEELVSDLKETAESDLPKLDRAFALEVWVPALRSGAYLPAVGRLGRKNRRGQVRYDALGVAATLLVNDETGWMTKADYLRAFPGPSEEADLAPAVGDDNTIGPGRVEWDGVLGRFYVAGIPEVEGMRWPAEMILSVCGCTRSLPRGMWALGEIPEEDVAKVSDDGMSFDEIATFIEEMLA